MGELTAVYRELVEGGSTNFTGLTITRHAVEIGALMTRHWAHSAIDIGSGRGDQYAEPYSLQDKWGIERITLYDPAFKEHSELPAADVTFDAVLCCDVLEHVPEIELDEFIGELFRRADKFVWASVCCRKAKKKFPDGKNMHVTIKGINWWTAKFEKSARAISLSRFGSADAIEWHLIETP